MSRISRAVTAVSLTAGLLAAASGANATIYYVRANAASNGSGLTWATAFNNLQSAIAAAHSGDSVYVAGGVYTPTLQRDGGFSRSKTFSLTGGVHYLGGFPASGGTLAQRDAVNNPTLLTGDLNGDDLSSNYTAISDDAYHVIFLTGNQTGTVVDGFYIASGNASDSDNFDYGTGAGILTSGTMTGLPQFRHCFIHHCIANDQGGGAKAFNAVFVFTTFYLNQTRSGGEGGGLSGGGNDIYNCKFIGNTAHLGGGYDCSGGPWIFNTLFSGNKALVTSPDAPGIGGGLYCQSAASSSIVSCTFVGNQATGMSGADQVDSHGGALYIGGSSSGTSIQNCIFWDNTRNTVNPFASVQDRDAQIYQPGGIAAMLDYSFVQNLGTGGGPGVGAHNHTSNPLFVNAKGPDNTYGTQDDNGTLQLTSPAIDAGNANALGTDVYDINDNGITNEAVPLDAAGLNRFVDISTVANTGVGGLPVDIGAYEAQAAACYANCDNSTVAPVLNVNDFICFQTRFAAGDTYANCDGSTTAPVLNVNDFVCFQTRFAAGCP